MRYTISAWFFCRLDYGILVPCTSLEGLILLSDVYSEVGITEPLGFFTNWRRSIIEIRHFHHGHRPSADSEWPINSQSEKFYLGWPIDSQAEKFYSEWPINCQLQKFFQAWFDMLCPACNDYFFKLPCFTPPLPLPITLPSLPPLPAPTFPSPTLLPLVIVWTDFVLGGSLAGSWQSVLLFLVVFCLCVFLTACLWFVFRTLTK